MQEPWPGTAAEPGLSNLQHWLQFLTSHAVTKASAGKIAPLTAAEACGFLACVIVETGQPELEQLDPATAAAY